MVLWWPLLLSSTIVAAILVSIKQFKENNESGYTEEPINEGTVVRNKNTQITANFNASEYYNKNYDSTNFRVDARLVKGLQVMRNTIDRPIKVISGYRNPTQNKKVGGTPNSYHLFGMAADIKVAGYSVDQMAALAKKLGFGGVGKYRGQGFLHVDIGPRREWVG